jgi:TRIAD3 protein (E3 ubiquitin-protein ligase RNF216)
MQKVASSLPKGKGKAKVLEDANFEAERQWLLDFQQNKAEYANSATLKDDPVEDDDDDDGGEGIECGCCFASYAFVRHFAVPPSNFA